jgi:hypothetical protein
MQGYADRDLPAKPVRSIAAYVAAPMPLASSIRASIIEEAKKRGMIAQDALEIFPPTRAYTNAEIRQGLTVVGVDGILVINVGDTGVIQQYAGTYFQSQTSGTVAIDGTMTSFGSSSNIALSGNSSSTTSGLSTPIYRYRRQTDFTARLIEPASGRNLWIGNGQVRAGGLLFVGDGTSASNSISAIFDDLQKKGIITGSL